MHRRASTPIGTAGRDRAVLADRGSATLVTVLLTPVFVVLAMMAFQAALWSHARSEVRAVARDSAALVARNGAEAGDVERSAVAVLDGDTSISDTVVVIADDGELVTARITARAPGLIRGMSTDVDVTVAIPLEGFRP